MSESVSKLVTAETLGPEVRACLKDGLFLEDVTALEAAEGFVVLYHFQRYEGGREVRVAVEVSREAPVVPSIADIYQGAEWHEREAADFYGLRFVGNPNAMPLLLPETFPGPPPLLKEEKARAPRHVLLPEFFAPPPPPPPEPEPGQTTIETTGEAAS